MKHEINENKAVVAIAEAVEISGGGGELVLLMEHDQQFVHRRGWGPLVPFLLL